MARSGRILVVDDEANARTALAELLREEGLGVETAADAFKALGKFESFTPDVVITDLKMPGMDGIELVRHLPPNVRPVAITGMPAIPGSTMAEIERYAIIETLKAAGGSTSKAAEMLGISARTIQYRLHEYQAAPRSDVEVVQAKGPDVGADKNGKT